jgi:hypothetical protein
VFMFGVIEPICLQRMVAVKMLRRLNVRTAMRSALASSLSAWVA